MNRITTSSGWIRPTLDRALRLPMSLGRRGRWPLALGALLLAASTASVVGTANSAPVFTSLALSKPVLSEGESVTLTGAFNDPDPAQRHTLIVYWHGGEPEEEQQFKQKIQLPAGQSTFQVSHVYADNFPAQAVKVVVFDHDLPDGANDNTGGLSSDTEFLPISVKNAAPAFVPSSVTVLNNGGGDVVVEGDVVDPAAYDVLRVAAYWSDPSSPGPKRCTMSSGTRHFRCEYIYANVEPATYAITLTVRDDDSGQSTFRTKVELP